MHLCRLEARRFRNLRDLVFQPDPRINVIAGPNAQGKTNVLEAAHMLLCQRSFRASRLREMIEHDAETAQLKGLVEHTGLDYDLAVDLSHRSRRLSVNGKATRRPTDWPEGLTSIVFTPDDLTVPRGAPAQRRQLIDRAVSAVWPAYAQLLRDYQRTLASRNRLLKEPPVQLARLLGVYDEQLAPLGAKIIAARLRYLQAIEQRFCDAWRRIAPTDGHASLRYETIDPGQLLDTELPSLASSLAALLDNHRSRDIARRMTTIGPHTDDIAFSIAGRAARTFASQGQTRSLVLAFKIAQIMDTSERCGDHPILLLDDVSSELDRDRNLQLFEFLSEISCQLFLTTTRPELVPLKDFRIDYHMLNGEIALA